MAFSATVSGSVSTPTSRSSRGIRFMWRSSATIIMRTGMPHHHHCQVARLDIAHLRTHLDHFTERLVPNHQVLRASRRSAELERGNLLIGATHANLQHAQLHLRRRRDLRLLMIDQLYLVCLRKNSNSFHTSLLSQKLGETASSCLLADRGDTPAWETLFWGHLVAHEQTRPW